MAKAQQTLNESINNNKPLDFLSKMVELDDHLKELMKKVLNNEAMSESFFEFLKYVALIPGNELGDQFISDKYFGSLIAQIW